MARKSYTEEFRERVVDLDETTPGAALQRIASDLGVCRGALKDWVSKLGSGSTPVVSDGSGLEDTGESGVALPRHGMRRWSMM